MSIGFTDEASEGNWLWITGEPVTFTNWNWGEPNGGHWENYVHTNWGGFGMWNDHNSVHANRYVLEVSATRSKISGVVWNDENNNGIKDESEGVLENWRIKFSGPTNGSALTDATGNYNLNIFLPGTYTISEEKQSNWAQTYPPAPGTYTINIIGGEDTTGFDFGNLQLGSISGFKFNDSNGNGIKEEDENGIAGWKIYISGDKIDSTTTDQNGNYTFQALQAGSYVVSEEQRHDWVQTYPISPGIHNITLFSSQQITDINFGNKSTVDLSLFTYAGEFNGSRYYISKNAKYWHAAKADCEANGGHLVTISDANENYFVSNLANSELYIGLTDEENEGVWKWVTGEPVTYLNWGGGQPDNCCGGEHYVATNWGFTFWNDGSYYTALRYVLEVPANRSKISGVVWNDENNNGIKDVSEGLLENWRIKFSGPTNGSALTDATGNYNLNIFLPGIYTISEEKQSNWAQTYPPAPGTYTINIIGGEDTTGFDFGNRFAPTNIVVSPLSLSATLYSGDTTSQQLTISNTGESDLIYNIDVQDVIDALTGKTKNKSLQTNPDNKIGFYADETRQDTIIDLDALKKQMPDMPNRKANAGTILATYANFPDCNFGMVWVGNNLYVVDRCRNMVHKYDTKTQSVVASFPIHIGAWSITWDGQYLWIGSFRGNVYGYDLSGNRVGSFSLPERRGYPFTWDGQYFVVIPLWWWGGDNRIHRIDYSGKIVETVVGFDNYSIMHLVWVPQHTSGNLWTIKYGGEVQQWSIVDGTVNFVKSFLILQDWWWYNSLAHNGKDLWWARDWGGTLYQIDDGISEILRVNPSAGIVPVGTSQDVQVTFTAIGIDTSINNANILVLSNDLDEDTVTVSTTLNVTGAPDIKVQPSNISFATTFVGWSKSDTLVVRNDGVQPLIVNNITISNNQYSVNSSGFTLSPGQKQKIIVTFTPTTAGLINSDLTFYSNDPSNATVVVNISGTAMHPPVIGVNPNSFSFTLTEGDSTNSTLNISNTGLGELHYDIENEFIFAPPALALKKFDVSLIKNEKVVEPYKQFEGMQMPEDIPITEELTNETINPQAQRLFGVLGRYLYELNVQTGKVIRRIQIPQSNYWWQWAAGLAFSGSKLYYTDGWDMNIYVIDPNSGKILRTYPKPEFIDGLAFVNGKLYALAPQSNTIYEMNPYDGTVLRTITPPVYLGGGLDGGNGRLFATNYGHHIYEISIIDGSVINSFPVDISVRGIGFCGERLFVSQDWYLTREYNPNTGEYIRDLTNFGFFGLAGSSTPWLIENPVSGIVPPGGNQNIDLKVNAKELHAGKFDANIVVNSNDPITGQKVLPVNLTVTGIPDIVLLSDSINFGETYMNVGRKDSIVVRNAGTDSLRITNITSDNPLFTIKPVNAVIPVGGKKAIHVTFVPTALGEVTGTLSINSNDPDQPVITASLKGVGITPPPSISGTKTVGVGGDFTTLAAAFDSINSCYISDTLRLVLINQYYPEHQLTLRPAANKPDAPPLIIVPQQSLYKNSELHLSKPVIFIDHSDTLESVGIYITDASNVQFKNVTIVLDTLDSWETAIRIEGACPDIGFNDVLLDGGNAYLGFEVWGNNASLNIDKVDLSNINTGMYASERTSLTILNSSINNKEDAGIWFEIYGSGIRIDSNTFNGNNSSYQAIGGYINGNSLNINNNNISGYQEGAISVGAEIQPEMLASKVITKKTTSRKSVTEIRETIKQKIAAFKNRKIEINPSLKKSDVSVAKTNSIVTTNNISISGNTISNNEHIEYGIGFWGGGTGSIIIENNNIDSCYMGISGGIYTDGEVSIKNNQLRSSNIWLEEVRANNLKIEDNVITGFNETGIWMNWFGLYNPNIQGGVSISRNTIIQNDSNARAWTGIFNEGVEANWFKIEDNFVSGMIEYDGLTVGGLYPPYPYWKTSPQKRFDKNISIKDRIVQLKSGIKKQEKELTLTDIKANLAGRKATNLSKQSNRNAAEQSVLSIQRNQVLHSVTSQYGVGNGIAVWGGGGPITVTVKNNSVNPETGEIEYGIYLGYLEDGLTNIEIEQNTIRKAYNGIMMEYAGISSDGSLIARNNDIETYYGQGLWLGEVYEAKNIHISQNTITATEPTNIVNKRIQQLVDQRRLAKTSKTAVGELGIGFWCGSESAEDGSIKVDSNIVSGYWAGIMMNSYINGSINITNNQLTSGGIWMEEMIGSGLTIEDNRINGFNETGISLPWFGLYNPDVPGGVSISRNTIIQNDSDASAWTGIYNEGIEAYWLKVEDNSVSGLIEGDGITVGGLYSQYWKAAPKTRFDKNVSIKDRLVQLRSGVKKMDKEPTLETIKTKLAEKKAAHSSRQAVTKADGESYLSVQRNNVSHQGGGSSLAIYGGGGPLTVTIKNNSAIPENGETEFGIYLGCFEEGLTKIEIEQNTIRKAYNGIMMECAGINSDGSLIARNNDIETYYGQGLWLGEVYGPDIVEIKRNTIRAIEPTSVVNNTLKEKMLNTRNTKQTNSAIGEQGITVYPYSEGSGTIVSYDSNNVSGYFSAIHAHGYLPGNISIRGNQLQDGGIWFCEGAAQNLFIDGNTINGFNESGISLNWFGLYNYDNPGGVSISRNSIIQNDENADAWTGIYNEGIEAYWLKVEDNIVSGMIEGDGIVAGGLFSPEPFGKTVQKTVRNIESPLSAKDRLANQWAKVKKGDRKITLADLKNKATERSAKQSTPKLQLKNSGQSFISIQRNTLQHSGGGESSIALWNGGGPLTVKVKHNNIVPKIGETEFGIFMGWFGEGVSSIEVEQNHIRKANNGIFLEGTEFFENGSLFVRDNDIESYYGSGMFLGEIYEPTRVEIKRNKIKAIDFEKRNLLLSKPFASNSVYGETGLGLYTYSSISGSNITVDSNVIQNFSQGMSIGLGGFENINVSRNTIQNNENGVYWESWADNFNSGIFTKNIISENEYSGGEFYFDGYPTPFNFSHNTFADNDSIGLKINGSGVLPEFHYNSLYGSNNYLFINESEQDVNARYNWWGETTTAEMAAGPYPKNITAIFDSLDDTNFGFVEYADWLVGPPGETYGSISGKVFNDVNGDCIIDPSETGLNGWVVKLLPIDLYVTTGADGNYRFDNLPRGTYTISQKLKQHWQQTCPSSPGTIQVVLDSGEVASNKNFGNRIISGIKDLSIKLASGVARPGFENIYAIRYESKGTDNIYGASVTFTHPLNTTLIYSGVHPATFAYDPSTRTVTWGLGLVTPGTVGYLKAPVRIAPPPVVNNGDTLKSISKILPIVGDITPVDNEAIDERIVQGSYDPNDKIVCPTGISPNGIVPRDTELSYMIRFQNTGTDTAFNVIIRDTLDIDLDMNTIEIGASSHPSTLAISGHRELKWTFSNILLPDSNVNEPGSHGFINFKVKPKPDSDTLITNTASIYFDYNLPVRTNTVENRLINLYSLTLNAGWNMLSVPYKVPNNYYKHLFSNSMSNAFTFEGNYVTHDSLKNGAGYWVKFSTQHPVTINGNPLDSITIPVRKGWNMIGSLSTSISTANVVPLGITINSPFYGYQAGYTQSSTIVPGKGYWVKVSENGMLRISKFAGKQLSNEVNNADELSLLNSISVKDKIGSKQTLYFGDEKNLSNSKTYYELPPGSPEFDVRFNSGLMVETYSLQSILINRQNFELVVEIKTENYPIEFSWDIDKSDLQGYTVKLNDGVKDISVIDGSGSLVIDKKEIKHIIIRFENGLPKEFALAQNYPNPFNPNTEIKYQLPVNSRVTLKIYNMLGQEVKTLVDEIQEAGYRRSEWNSTNNSAEKVASGVYFYRIDAASVTDPGKSFVQVKKMILLK